VEFLQPSRLWPTFSLRGHSRQTLGGLPHSLRQTPEETPHRPLRPGSLTFTRMCQTPQTSIGPTDLLRGGAAVDGSHPSPRPRHRRPPGSDPHYERKRWQRKNRARLAKVAAGAARVLETPAATQLSFPWEDGGCAPFGNQHPEGVQAGGDQGGNHQGCHSPYAASFLRDWHAGSGGRSANDQQAAGTFELCDDHDLSARAASTLRPLAQPDRLAAGAAVSAVGRAIGADAATGHLRHHHSPSNAVDTGQCRGGKLPSDSADSPTFGTSRFHFRGIFGGVQMP